MLIKIEIKKYESLEDSNDDDNYDSIESDLLDIQNEDLDDLLNHIVIDLNQKSK